MAELLVPVGTVNRPGPSGLEVALRRDADEWQLQVDQAGSQVLALGIGLIWDGRDIAPASGLTGSDVHLVTEDFVMSTGKAARRHVAQHAEHLFKFSHADAGSWELLVRIADDGVAMRYRVPAADGELGAASARLTLHSGHRLWFQDYQTWYENPMRGAAADDVDEGDLGLPVLVGGGANYLLLTESDVNSTSSGSHLHAVRAGQELSLDFEPADPALPVTGDSLTPWRVVVIGSLADIVESNLVDELATAADGPAPTWVAPGPAVWSWWSDHYSGSQPAAQRRFVDFAAELGWRHVLVDCGWVEDWVPALVSYASGLGIQVHLWCRWSDLATPLQRRKLGRWAAWGVAGIKVDFMESESNERYRWYQATIEEALDVGLMVNLHGSVIPRGWARRWPHVLSFEAVRANEYYTFYQERIPTTHHVILPFTRNVVGSMDFTPAALRTTLRDTTEAAEAAQLVLFECGLTHLADDPDAYRSRPSLMRLLRLLPETWQETVLLDGHPDSHVVLARSDGKSWFIAGMITGEGRTLRIPLERIGNPTQLWLLRDGDVGLAESMVGTVEGALELQLPDNGGFVALSVPTPEPGPHRAPLHVPSHSDAVLGSDGAARITAPLGTHVITEPGWTAVQESATSWKVSQVSSETVASTQVALRHSNGTISHVRLHRRLEGITWLSDLPFQTFHNHFGPVERDQSNGGGNPGDGSALTISGVRHDRGLGMSAPAAATFFLAGGPTRFRALVGIDDESESGQAIATVILDGQPLAQLQLAAGRPAQAVDVDITGGLTLTLAAGDVGDTHAHVDWAAARVSFDKAEGIEAHSAGKEGKQ